MFLLFYQTDQITEVFVIPTHAKMVENAGKWDRTALNVAAPSSTMEDTVSVSKQ